MLTLSEIKKLTEYTTSLKVIKAAMNLDASYLPYAIAIYTDLGKEELFIPQEYIDIIAENYINQRLINSKIEIENLIKAEEFRSKVATLTTDELNKYMELCDADNVNDLLTNKSLLASYSAKDHFEIIPMGDEMRTKPTEIKDIFFAAISHNCPVATIKEILSIAERGLNEINRQEITRLLTSEQFYRLNNRDSEIEILSAVILINDIRVLKLLVNIALTDYWVNTMPFSKIVELAKKTTNKNQSLLEKEATYQRSFEEIEEMLSITSEDIHLAALFSSKPISNNLSYEQIVNLINTYNLGMSENFDRFTSALSKIVQKGYTINLYEELCQQLNQDTYERTIAEYLDTCSSIGEFIQTLEQQYKDDDPINPDSKLNLKIN